MLSTQQATSPSSPNARHVVSNGVSFPVHVFGLASVMQTSKVLFEQWVREGDEPTKQLLQRISKTRQDAAAALARSGPDGALRALDTYLPCALGMSEGLAKAIAAAPDSPLPKQIRVSWTSSVNANALKTPMSFDSMSAELLSVYIDVALLHRAAAQQKLSTIFASDEAFDEGSKEVARLLCTAAGVFEYVRDTQCPQFEGIKLEPPVAEVSRDFQTMFINMCLAEAQQLAVLKAVAKGTSDSLVAKLVYDIAQKYHDASYALRAIAGVEFVEPLRLYLTLSHLLFMGLTYKHLARDARAKSEYGRAVAFAQKALAELPEKPKSATVRQAEACPTFGAFVAAYGAEREEIARLAKAYANENDKIAYEPVPDATTLEPPAERRSLMKPVPYTPPQPISVELTLVKSADCLLQ